MGEKSEYPVGSKRGRSQNGNRYSGAIGRASKGFDWGSVDSSALHRAVVAVATADDAVMFARTSDGGAGLIRIISGGDGDSVYCKTAEEANELLNAITAQAEGFAEPT
jgi:hypothetical protein